MLLSFVLCNATLFCFFPALGLPQTAPPLTMQSKIAHTDYFLLLSGGTHSGYRLWKMWPTSVVSWWLSPEKTGVRNAHTCLPRKSDSKFHVLSYMTLFTTEKWIKVCVLLPSQLQTYLYCVNQNSKKLCITLFNRNAFKKANTAGTTPLKNGNTSNLVSEWPPQLLKTKSD